MAMPGTAALKGGADRPQCSLPHGPPEPPAIVMRYGYADLWRGARAMREVPLFLPENLE